MVEFNCMPVSEYLDALNGDKEKYREFYRALSIESYEKALELNRILHEQVLKIHQTKQKRAGKIDALEELHRLEEDEKSLVAIIKEVKNA